MKLLHSECCCVCLYLLICAAYIFIFQRRMFDKVYDKQINNNNNKRVSYSMVQNE